MRIGRRARRGAMGVLVDDAALMGTFELPAFTCGVRPAGTEIGTGSGTLAWSNGRTSAFTATLRSPGTSNEFDLEMRLVRGLWAGTWAAVRLGVVSSVGNCVSTPVSSAVLTSTGRFELHPGPSPSG